MTFNSAMRKCNKLFAAAVIVGVFVLFVMAIFGALAVSALSG
jgi:hypothetical protein